MAESLQLYVGKEPWTLSVPAERLVKLRRAAFTAPTQSPAEMAREALEHPHEFEAMRRALTPDDHVTIVLDPTIPELGPILTEVFTHLHSAGIPIEAVTVLTPPGATDEWLDEVPDEFEGVRTEIHDPTDRQKLAYLAATSGGRRLYLNRTLVDADFVVVVSGRRYDPHTGYEGAEAAVFPTLSDEETRNALVGELSVKAPGEEPWPLRAEAAEVLYLLGTPFLVQVIEGEANTIQEIVAGLPTSSAEGIRRQDARWHAAVSEVPDTVVVAMSGSTQELTFLDLAKAAACAARVVRKGGRIAILTTAAPDLGDGARLLRSMDGPTGAKKLLAKEKPDDLAACLLWVFAAKNHSLYLASGYPDDVAEELFTTPIRTASEVQRLIDGGDKVLVIPDAHKTMVTVDD
jgi:nickel-dependent lactate racemase